ncbi:MAG: methionine--tRNA ligase [Candidatus Omnitrophica bacterium]|nr:methionine--tRNA ligase [Candidatus Omnitrophota bacterium]
MEKNKFYITTPLYYVNASPHIGHSYTTIAADCLSRFMRAQLGKDNVFFLTGTDEHGQKVQKAADAGGMSPQEFADQTVSHFKSLWEKLGISYDYFIRTTDKKHVDFVSRVLEIVYEKGDIYEDEYEGLYCTPCEAFWTKMQAGDSLCPDCKRPVELIKEKNYFFKLAKYQDWLIDHIKKNPEFIKPEIRRNEVLSFLSLNKLDDLCISRPKERLGWGIPLPFSSGHVTYVWFDALVNYISAVGDFNNKGEYSSRWWPADVQLIGKDILRQHAVYWPIMLKALGVELPKTIFAHGWWMLGDSKMSKSRGNVVNPLDMAEKYGIDTYRYFLLRDVPFGLDGNFSEEAIIKRYNSDLANDLGNLVYRTLTMIEKYYQGKIPEPGPRDEKTKEIYNKIASLPEKIKIALADYNFGLALEEIWALINLANKHVEETKPWNLAKENRAGELQSFIRLLADVIKKVSEVLYPFMPDTAEAIKAQFGETEIKKGKPLFPRIET